MPWIKYEITNTRYDTPEWYDYVTHNGDMVKNEDGTSRPWTLEEAKEVVRKADESHKYYARTYDYYKFTEGSTTWFERTKKGEPAPTYDPTKK
jgi:hypothetical protein